MRNRTWTGLTAAWLVACGAHDEMPADGTGPIATLTQASSDEDDFIDREPVQNPAKLPVALVKLVAEGSKVGKILSSVDTYGGMALKALEMLGYLQSEAEIQQARFDALHEHLDDLGVKLVEVDLAIARDNRLSRMRTSVNNVRVYAQRGGGLIDESLLSGSEIVELGNARSFSQEAAQNATEISAHQGYYHETVTNGDRCTGDKLADWVYDADCWKRYVSDRPGPNGSITYDWRLGTAEMLQLIAARLAIIGTTDPSFRSNGERMGELGQYREKLVTYHQKMVDGIRCWGVDGSPVRVGCVDINTGLEVSTTFNEPSCFNPYNQATCQARIAPYKERFKRALMTRLPLFEMRSMIDALAQAMSTNDELTTNPRIRMWGTENCLTNANVYEYETNPWEPTLVPNQWTAWVATCSSDVAQEWHYDRGSGQIKNAWGACLGQRSFDLNHPWLYGTTLWVEDCSDRGSQHWTYDPWGGVLENAFHTVLGAPLEGGTWGQPRPKAELPGASAQQAWQSPPFEFQSLPQQIDAIQNADGRLELFFLGAGGPLLHNSQNVANGAWSNEPALGGLAKQLAMAKNADGRLEIFYVGTNNVIYHDYQTTPGGAWSGELALGGTAKQIAVGQNLDGRLEVFYVGMDDAIYHNWQVAPNDAWVGEYAFGGWAKQLAVGQNLDGRLEVFYIGTNDAIHHNRQVVPNGGWAGEALLAGWAKQIAVARNQDGRLELFSIGTNDNLYHNWQSVPNGEFAGESWLGGAAKLLVMGQNQDGRLEAFYVGMDDNLYHNTQVAPNSWWAGEAAMGNSARQVAIGRNQDGRQELFFVSSDGTVSHRWQVAPNSGTWSNAVAFP